MVSICTTLSQRSRNSGRLNPPFFPVYSQPNSI
ncbi:hypothetical protein C5167_041817 [Papaver somniferum]|nr:hypothetical protein C5167_041817 [Papaver somniferum]